MPGVKVGGTRGPIGFMPAPIMLGGGGKIGMPFGVIVGWGERASGYGGTTPGCGGPGAGVPRGGLLALNWGLCIGCGGGGCLACGVCARLGNCRGAPGAGVGTGARWTPPLLITPLWGVGPLPELLGVFVDPAPPVTPIIPARSLDMPCAIVYPSRVRGRV